MLAILLFSAVTWGPCGSLEFLAAVQEESKPLTKRERARREKARAQFPGRKRQMLIEAGHRHLELGVWCRDKGLISQATMEILLAVEVAEHQHPGAQKVLNIMRGYGEAFWKKRRTSFPKHLLDQYEKRSAKVVQKNIEERYAFAEWAYDLGLEEGEQEFRTLVQRLDAPLEFDSRERLVIPGGSVPLELSQTLRDEAVRINDRWWMRDEFLRSLPEVEALHKVENDRVRVRTLGSLEAAQGVLEACTALLPVLAQDTGGRPKERLNLFLFASDEGYERYLTSQGLEAFRSAKGFALSASRTACLNATGLSDEDLRALALHELTHLFVYGITRTRMPDWYSEGFAETYGGQGCHHREGETWHFHGSMAEHRLARLRRPEHRIPLSELLAGDALTFRAQGERGLDFYAQSWAWLRFLRTAAGEETREKLAYWEAVCRGKALGAVFDKPTEQGDVQPAQALFQELFGADLDRLEGEFQAYMNSL